MTHTRECLFPWDTVGDAADCCGTLVDIADTRGKTRGCPATLADTADVGDIGIGTQRSRGIITSYVKVIRVGDQDEIRPLSLFYLFFYS